MLQLTIACHVRAPPHDLVLSSLFELSPLCCDSFSTAGDPGLSLDSSWKEIIDEILPRIWVREADAWQRAITLGKRFGLSPEGLEKIEADAEHDMAGLALATQKLRELLVSGRLPRSGGEGQVDLTPIAQAMAELEGPRRGA